MFFFDLDWPTNASSPLSASAELLVYLPVVKRIKPLHNENVLRETQTLRAGCSKTEPKIFAPPQTPFPEAQDGQNLTSWRWSLPLPKKSVWWGSMHAISSCRDNRPPHTHKHTYANKQTHNQDRLQYTAPQLASVQCNNFVNVCCWVSEWFSCKRQWLLASSSEVVRRSLHA